MFVLFFLQGLAPRVRTVRERQLQPSRQQTAGREGRRNVPITGLVLQAPRDSSEERKGEKRRAFRGKRVPAGEGLCVTDIPSHVPGPGMGRCPAQKAVFHGWCLWDTQRAGRTERRV